MSDYDTFRKRLATFDALKWIGHPIEASPLKCARYGWRNEAYQILQCDACHEVFPLSVTRRRKRPSDLNAFFDDLFLTKHKAACVWRQGPNPEEFAHLPLEPLEIISKEFLERFDAFCILWDLPDLEEGFLQEAMKSRFERLAEFLYNRWTQSMDQREIQRWNIVLKHRTRSQAFLALLGWELKWAPNFVYLNKEDMRFSSFSKGQTNDPKETEICFGHQSFLTCSICNAKIGLWTFKTRADLDAESFREMSKKLKRSKDVPFFPKMEERKEKEPEKVEIVLNPAVFRRPAFGLRGFTKVQAVELPLIPKPNIEEESIKLQTWDPSKFVHPVSSMHRLHVVERHRFFCPYKTEWSNLLKVLIGTEF